MGRGDRVHIARGEPRSGPARVSHCRGPQTPNYASPSISRRMRQAGLLLSTCLLPCLRAMRCIIEELQMTRADLICDVPQRTRLVALGVPTAAHCRSRPQLATEKVPNDEGPILKRALAADGVPFIGKTDVFEGAIELIAPEGVRVVVWHAPVQDCCSGRLSLLLGVVVVLDSYAV